MGNQNSTSHENLKGIFGKELKELNDLCFKIISKEDSSKFTKNKYNIFINELYDNHVLVLEKELNKHLKVDLEQLNSSIYFLPKKQENVINVDQSKGFFSNTQNKFIKKSELTKMISQHYLTVLNMVKMITQVYDLESGGDYSIAGILKRNITMENGLLVINYCNMAQFDYDQGKRVEKVNFGNLKGVKLLTKLMTNDESRAFTKHLNALLSDNTSQSKLEKTICENNLLYNTKDFSELFKKSKGINIDCSKHQFYSNTSEHDLFLSVSKNNPIFAANKCLDKKKVIINLHDKNISKQNKKLYNLYDTFTNNYKNNIQNVFSNLYDVIDIKNGFIIKDVSNNELQSTLNKLKIHIMKFYINSIVDYKNLLDQAKKIGSVNVNKNNL
jgi:hypothetical protein